MSTMAVIGAWFPCWRLLVANGRAKAKPWPASAGSANVTVEAPMSYVDSVLQPGEEVRYRANVHWVIYLPGLLLWALAAVLYFLFPNWPGLQFASQIAALICFAAGALLMMRAWFRRWTTEIAITNKRIIYKRGFIRRFSAEMHMDKVESVDVNQTVLGRILDYGDVIVRGTGSGLEPFPSIDAPLQFRNHVTAV
jgi:membrane protein YdbS with pleckstrin-like domain